MAGINRVLHMTGFPNAAGEVTNYNGGVLGTGTHLFTKTGVAFPFRPGIPVPPADKAAGFCKLPIDCELDLTVDPCTGGTSDIRISPNYHHDGSPGYPTASLADPFVSSIGGPSGVCQTTCPTTCNNLIARRTYTMNMSLDTDNINNDGSFLFVWRVNFIALTDTPANCNIKTTIFDIRMTYKNGVGGGIGILGE